MPELMYHHRKKQGGNVGVTEGCKFHCIYCSGSFQATLKRFAKHDEDNTFTPHLHLERLNTKPPRTEGEEFVSIGLTGDICFAPESAMRKIIDYCLKWKDRTRFLIQSKNPAFFSNYNFPANVMLGTTIETNQEQICKPQCEPLHAQYIHYNEISKAPLPEERCMAMIRLKVTHKENPRVITIEPILSHDLETMIEWMKAITPARIYIGYDSHSNENRLSEPTLAETQRLIFALRGAGFTVYEKLIRKAWYE